MSSSAENIPKTFPSPAVPKEETGHPAAGAPPACDREDFIGRALADYESPLLGYATTLLNDLEQARDVVQDTFVRLCEQDLSKIAGGLKPWLFTVCRNRALDVLRKEKPKEPLEEIRWKKVAGSGLQPDEVAHRQEKLSRLARYLDRLTPNQREVIILKFQQGLSYHDIEEITRLSSSNIGFLIHTGLRRLREIMPDDMRI
ncbi:sigma-70 family RNA polymerase sigma factor [Luteolibacter yonseiensis]|uniref:Sigma-70 family RNA polymerase sigma factor n=1 Tax=Luteolibacter yonseiensis TaxID=1144680 RepID=A0A934R3H6_9BACT|nr:sigma-70 family RNA polymerase sigma factor [Luteolibacter yonseiensis]MBK1815611.1 sigma-70 family RNA polymerase sigma factor [Luteolibacter yonseiensis]